MVACELAIGLFFLAGIGAGALGHAGFRALQEEGGVEALWVRLEAWRRNRKRRGGRGFGGGGLRGGRNRYQPIRHSQHNPVWRVVSTHTPTLSTPPTAAEEQRALPDIIVDNYNEELSPTSSEDGGWLQL